MKPSARLDAHRFAVCRQLLADLGEFADELTRVPRDWFVPYPDTELYGHGWSILLLLLRWSSPPEHFEIPRNRQRCPRSAALLERFDRIHAGGFSRLLPGARIAPHTDRPLAGILRLHVCLGGADAAFLELDGVPVQLCPWRAIVFDPSLPHAAQNRGTAARDALIVDFEVSPEEAAELRRDRGCVNAGATSDMPPEGEPG